MKKLDSQTFDIVVMQLGLSTEAAKEALTIALENIQLIDRKQRDYGPHNISKFMDYGCMVRMSDKLERLINLYNKKSKGQRAVNESMEDSFRDLSNYAIIALLCRAKKWPLTDEPKSIRSASGQHSPPSTDQPV